MKNVSSLKIVYFIPIVTTKFAYYAAFRGCPGTALLAKLYAYYFPNVLQ